MGCLKEENVHFPGEASGTAPLQQDAASVLYAQLLQQQQQHWTGVGP